MDAQTAQNALESALNADIGNLLLVVMLVMAIAFALVIMVFNRAIKNSGGAATDSNNVIRELAVHLGTAVENNTKAMESIRDVQIMTLNSVSEVKTDTSHIRTDTDGTQARLREIKSQLDTMETELAAVRVGVDNILKDKSNA